MNKIALVFLALFTCVQAADNLPNTPSALQTLADQGNHEAMTKLGYFYFSGNQVEKSYEKAFSLYRNAAEAGNLSAMSNLCNMYLYGAGVEKNLALAFQLCTEPARAGNSSSMVMLAEIVQKIDEGPLSEDKELSEKMAFQFYRMAAIRDHMHGQYMLGRFYEQGLGTSSDQALAKEWYEKSAAQGHEGAIKALAQLEEAQTIGDTH